MLIRRYYKKGVPYKYTISDEFLQKMKDDYGEERAHHIDNASYEIILETLEEESSWFADCCSRVLSDTRWYLEHLDSLPTFRVHHKALFPKKRF